jgi:membrane carboxypeptidase/penicillin-binding protein
MEAAHRGKPMRDIEAPPGVVEVWIDADTGYRAGAECEHVMREAFVLKTEPKRICSVLHLIPSWPDSAAVDSTASPPEPDPESEPEESQPDEENVTPQTEAPEPPPDGL